MNLNGLYKPVTGTNDSPIGNTRLYTGREYDKEISLYYLRARYYDAGLGRFVSRDPIGMKDNVNLYTYVANSPINYVDRMGKEKQPVCKEQYWCIKSIDITTRFEKTLNSSAKMMEEYWSARDLGIAPWMVSDNYLKQQLKLKLTKVPEDIIDSTPESVLTELQSQPYMFKFFYEQVKIGGPLDLKVQDYSDLVNYGEIIYAGNEYRYDDFGNINYGYAGAAAGFSEEVLLVLAGYAQLQAQSSKPEWTFEKSYYDDPRDQQMIKEGYQLYNSTKK